MSTTLHALVRPYGRGWMIATEPTHATPGAGDDLDARRADLHPEPFECWTDHGWAPATDVPMFFATERDASVYLALNHGRM